MTIRVAINHKTEYRYSEPVTLSPHIIRLRPAVHSRTPIDAYSIRIEPKKHFINWQQDPFGNYLARVVFPEKTSILSIEVDVVINMTVINPFDFFVEEYAKSYPFNYDPSLKKELAPYLEIREDGPLLKKYLSKIKRDKTPIIDFLVSLNQELQQKINYNIRMEPGIQSCEKTLEIASGSCRDSGWLMVQILRHLGLAARFVSGYLVQLTADQKSLDGPSGPEQDFTDLHAWCEVYVPGAGWCGLDATSGLFAGEGHIPLACTPSPESAAAVTGYADDCKKTEFYFHNKVSRIYEDPRVTKPYNSEQWKHIETLGYQVDQALIDGDVRLTMGGEPTFVSIDDMESAQWNTAALGAHKLERAHDLFQRLSQLYGHGGLLHYGQGKWYPGEPLPRWALNYYWRKDGKPIWNKRQLLAIAGDKRRYGTGDILSFGENLAMELGLAKSTLVPAHEDSYYYMWREGNLPLEPDPLLKDLKNKDERKQILKRLQGDLGQVVGYALPLHWDYSANAWAGIHWQFRRQHMFLIPGDSPMGFRLPLDSIAWQDAEMQPEQSQFQDLPDLGEYAGEVSKRYNYTDTVLSVGERIMSQQEADSTPQETSAATARFSQHPIHTAMCIELRNEQVYVFLPPLNQLEHYLDIIARIEKVAHKLRIAVHIEGYPPPKDWRINSFSVTPDPGVIEVNIHPAKNWNELVENTSILYEQAHLARLGTEKFMLDGRHTGTGGGNHVTLGGETPNDSPMLRRPELLASLLCFWQHHPGLSYLFSGMFIGPSSQAPRIDEARNESLYELEIALAELPRGVIPQPWLVDRLFRNILTDVTGNTHRAEFCIDKLYAPGSASGRLGLVEFRAFEMPPHAQMSLVQMLLLRSLIACFWKMPYLRRLVRWHTELHDRFMLPHYVWRDMKDVVNHINAAGFPFQLEWLAPFLEFRFPHYGSVNIGDIHIELRAAIEPWHVMGEEVTNLGTARFVDSSVERLQVRVSGFTDSRYVVTCNGQALPLRKTGVHGEYVCGVRYRAWQPPSALHPTIGIHSPLVIDVIDTWNKRSIGGCKYHVAHPGGRSYDVFPINAYAAETRRISRFWEFGHTPGTINVAPQMAPGGEFSPLDASSNTEFVGLKDIDPEYPYTLDLRRRGKL